jgi:hypothetical protein
VFATALGHCLRAERGSQPVPVAIPVGEPAATATTGPPAEGAAEGPATQLLARRVERIEAVPVPSPEAAGDRRPSLSRRLAVPAAALVSLGLVATIVYMAVRPTPPINVATEVSVQVVIPKWVQHAAVVLILDGKEVSKEDLAKPIPLKTGEHELVTKKGNEVVETRKFTVGKGDTTVTPFEENSDVVPAPDVQALIDTLLKDTDQKVRYVATESLKKRGATSAVEALKEALKDKASIVRFGAAQALQHLGAKNAVPALIERVGDDLWEAHPHAWYPDDPFNSWDGEKEQRSSKRAALDALRALAPERVKEALKGATKSNTPAVRLWAARELGKEKD